MRLRVLQACGALLLLAAAWYVGSKHLDAYWIQGDEFRFIVRNPDVTGVGDVPPMPWRLFTIFTHFHEDLYQPVPIASYAIQWSLFGPDPVYVVRATDVLLHGLNAVLIWRLLALGLGCFAGLKRTSSEWLALGLAFLWLAHPVHAVVYAADMNRTHLLAALFVATSLLCHAAALSANGPGRRFAADVGMLLTLILGCMSKPLVGMVVVYFVLEWARRGWRAALCSGRIFASAAVCAGFSLLTLAAAQQSRIVEDASIALFGGPLERALLATWMNVLHLIYPVGLSHYYLPDIHTGWGHPRVWMGLLVLIASVGAVTWGISRRRAPGIVVGVCAYWALILPTPGLFGGGVTAAQDRYLYLPAACLALLLGVGLARVALVRRNWTPWWGVPPAALGLALIPVTREYAAAVREPSQRAAMVLEQNPNDPRALEVASAAIEFLYFHPHTSADEEQVESLRMSAVSHLVDARRIALESDEYFPNPAARASFFRRLSLSALRLLQTDLAIAAVLPVLEIEPESIATLTRLAHAYRAAGLYDEASAVYEKIEELPDADPVTFAIRQMEYADLLLNYYEMPELALRRFRTAVESGHGTRDALVGWARCEVLVGDGQRGFELATEAFMADPGLSDAPLVIALYHLRSHNFEDALQSYAAVLHREPVNYEALRGFHELCAQFSQWEDALLVWQRARETLPADPVLRSWFVWTATCAGRPEAEQWVSGLLTDRPLDRFGRLSEMVLLARSGNWSGALVALRSAAAGEGWPAARELERAEKTVGLLIGQGVLPAGAGLLRAALLEELGFIPEALERLRSVSEAETDPDWLTAYQEVARRIEAAENR